MIQKVVGLPLALGVALWCGRARAQGDVLFPGSTAQGDVLRGEGVMYKGEAVLYLNSAMARSIDADTAMRWNEYVYRSYQEYNARRAQRIAGAARGRNAGLAEIRRRQRERPQEFDIFSGDALNVLLEDLADPRIAPAAWQAAKVALPAAAACEAPFQSASIGQSVSLLRLKADDPWPIALRYKGLEIQRRAYQKAVAVVLEECRRRTLAPESVEEVNKAVRALRSRADEVVPRDNIYYRLESRRFLDGLERTSRVLTSSSYVEDLLAELDDYRGATVADLLGFMRRFNLHFGPAEAPGERRLYLTLYPLIRSQADVLIPKPPSGLAPTPGPARPTPARTGPVMTQELLVLYVGRKDHDRAIAEYTDAIRRDPADARNYLARAIVTRSKLEAARSPVGNDAVVADCTEAIRLAPQEAEGFFQRGHAYAMQRRWDEGLADCTEAIRLSPTMARAYCDRGYCHDGRRELELAISDYDEDIRLRMARPNPSLDPRTLALRGWDYAQMGNHAKAIVDLDDAIRIWADYPEAHYYRSWVYTQSRDLTRAAADRDKALRLFPWLATLDAEFRGRIEGK